MRRPFSHPPALVALAAIGLSAALYFQNPVPVDCPDGTQPIQSARAQQSGRHCSNPIVHGQEFEAPRQHPLLRGPAPHPTLIDAALAEKAALQPQKKLIPKADGDWQPYATGQLIAGPSFYSARVDNFAYDPEKQRLFAAVGTGGIWMSTAVDGDITTLADQWVSVGDRLPTQVNGGVIWSPDANGDGTPDSGSDGTLLAAGGESVMGNNGYMGLGAYWTTNLGATWTRSTGFPNGVQVYNARFDPGHPNIFYIASSIGLFRSTDAGRSFVNVRLPSTPDCAGKEDISSQCQFANVVTDVAIRGPGGATDETCDATGCPVVAAIGWRAGQAFFADGVTPQGPGNGLYRSDTGVAGSFSRIDDEPINAALPIGFAPAARSGRIEFGTTTGETQDHNYLYALVQDAVSFNEGFNLLEPILDLPLGLISSNINGLYVSSDFGLSWVRMAGAREIVLTPGSINFPGAQAWYNQWIAIDPTRAVPVTGVPLRMTYGLEEVMQNITVPLDGTVQAASPQDFELIGRYTALIGTSTHPDQHAGLYIPDGAGGVCLFVGNDGGVFKQCVGMLEPMTQAGWGAGSNDGFYALLPYGVAVAKDGTVWQGHQDNGSGHIEPDTREQIMDFGADGFFAEVDPDNSDVAYTESQNGGLRRTIDRGASSSSIAPPYVRPNFANWFVLDPLDANHLLTGAQQIFSTLNAPTVTGSTWTEVFNLGTNPVTNAIRTTSTMHVYGPNVYVGFCGDCGSVAIDTGFANGIATNVGGTLPPQKNTADGWHFATAAGLDSRFIAGIEMDEANPKTIYVTLAGYAGNMRPPGSFGDPNAAKIGTGTVFKSTDAGESFTDISGNIPRAQANTVLLYKSAAGEQLIVGTDIGPFISSDNKGSNWAPLGNTLPNVPVNVMRFKPKATPDEVDTIFAATFGRGIWTYAIPKLIVDPPPPGTPPVITPTPTPPVAGSGRFGGSTGLWLLAGLMAALAIRKRKRHPLAD
ncbi:MAG: hypothetical protein Q7J29_10450 [Stagnimonas sp.]|nr:hypothetical protein [Stagnimonas sp.]